MRCIPQWLMLLALALCSPQALTQHSYLDETTAATVSVSAIVVFAREYPALAVNARDYLSLCAVQVNRSGRYTYYLFGYFWSTIDRRAARAQPASSVALRMLADDREFTLTPVTASWKELGIARAPCSRPTRAARAVLYATDPATLAYAASSQRLIVTESLSSDEDMDAWRLWTDRRRSFKSLAVAAGGCGSSTPTSAGCAR